MRLGIDGRILGNDNAGIKAYVESVIKYVNSIDEDDNTYFIYTDRELKLNFELKPKFVIRKYKSFSGTLALFLKVPSMLKKDKIDVFWGPCHILPKKIKGVSYVLTIHDLALFKIKRIGSFYNTLINKLFLKKSLKNADRVISISNSTKKDIVDIFNIDENKIEVIYNGKSSYSYYSIAEKVNNKEFASLREKYGIKREYFLFVGTVEPRKNLVNLLLAYDKLKKETKSDFLLVICGKIGWKNKKFKRILDSLAFKKDVIVTGYVSEKDKELIYRNASLLCFPSLYEGFGLPIIEAMSVGVPVLTSNVSSMPEIGKDKCIYVCKPQDYNELFQKLKDFYNGKYHYNADELVQHSLIFTSSLFEKETFEFLTRKLA